VKSDIVALHREELSPLRAESVRSHLASCSECREESLELALASRTYRKLPELEPPVDLITRTLRRISEAASGPVISSAAPAAEAAGVAHPASPPAPAAAASAQLQTHDAKEHANFLFRPIKSPFARLAVAACFMALAVAFNVPSVAEALGRAQSRIIGSKLTEKIDEATQNFLMEFFL
jgi:hypothetical protein